MRSDIITVNGSNAEPALKQAEAVAVYKHLSARGALHLRLLTEEMMGMMRSITGQPNGSFWIEDEDDSFELHLQVRTRMSLTKREQLMAVSTSGRNEAARGLMGRLRDFFDRDADSDVAPYTSGLTLGGMEDLCTEPTYSGEWSLVRYRQEVDTRRQQQESEALEAWDELERSVVAHLADEVKVFIRGDQVEMVIYKKLA